MRESRMKLLSKLFRKKDDRGGRVEAIVKYFDASQLPPTAELMRTAERVGVAVPGKIPAAPPPEPVAVTEEKRRYVPDAKPASPAPEPVAVAEKERLVVPEEKPAPSSPSPPKAPDREGWISPSYTQSRQVVLRPKRLLANRCVGYLCGSYESESYKVLRTRLLQKVGEKGGTTIMITSALPGEGKTLTAVNLSLTCAKEFNQTVMLVDSDLHKQSVHECLGFESNRGLADYLLNGTSLGDLIVWPGVEKFTVISGGRAVTTSSELLGSPRMKGLVKDLRSRYPDRYVIFDVPPVLAGADALAFAPQMDHIILVVRAGSTSIEDVKLALELLPREKMLGVVLNRVEKADVTGRYYTYREGKAETRKAGRQVTEWFTKTVR
jgi:non-specific protein-tyrosine kinase